MGDASALSAPPAGRDFDLFGEANSGPRSMRAASYFVKVMRATRNGEIFDPDAVRAESLRVPSGWRDTLRQKCPR
jgi:hypothetical protein